MNITKKKATRRIIFSFLVLLISIFAISNLSNFNVLAAGNLTLENGIYIYDENELLEEDVKTELNGVLVDLTDETDAEFFVVVVKETGNKNVEEYAQNIFSDLQLSKESVLLLISENAEDAVFIVGNELKDCFDKANINQFIESEIKTNLSSGYTVVTENIVNEVISIFEKKYDVEIEGAPNILLLVIIMIILIIIIVILVKKFGWDIVDIVSDIVEIFID